MERAADWIFSHMDSLDSLVGSLPPCDVRCPAAQYTQVISRADPWMPCCICIPRLQQQPPRTQHLSLLLGRWASRPRGELDVSTLAAPVPDAATVSLGPSPRACQLQACCYAALTCSVRPHPTHAADTRIAAGTCSYGQDIVFARSSATWGRLHSQDTTSATSSKMENGLSTTTARWLSPRIRR